MILLCTFLNLIVVGHMIKVSLLKSSYDYGNRNFFNYSLPENTNLQVKRDLHMPNSLYYTSGNPRQPNTLNRQTNQASLFSSQSTSNNDGSNARGMGLSLSDHNHISLGQLTTSKVERYLQHSSSDQSDNPNIMRSGSVNKKSILTMQYPKRSMQVIGQQINPNIVNFLHPDVSSRKLRRLWKTIVGNNNDKHWTSEEPPRVLRQRGVSEMMSDAASSNSNPTNTLLRKAQALNMTFRDQTGAQFLLPETQIQLFRNWLIEQATCEMDFVWKDLGSLYWPRWIRMGVCLSRFGSSCSWPPGMKCQPSGSRVLRLLNWNCEDDIQPQRSNIPLKRFTRATVNLPNNRLPTYSRQLSSPLINLHNHFRKKTVTQTPKQLEVARNNFYRQKRTYAHRSPKQYYLNRRRNGRRDVELNPAEEKERQTKRAKRLMEQLTITSNGYRCHWQIQNYLISDKCTCSCA